MDKLRVLDTFAGIGGFSLGLERTGGFETAAFCEIEPFCQRVLNKHWPDVPIYDDIRELNRERLESDGIGRIDVITGGFPCQDLSVAGKQAGIEGERSGLWSELCRVIGDIRPRYAIMENVTALIGGDSGRWLGRVLGDLAEIGYDAEWHCIPASELGAHHHRDRVWIIAYPNEQRCNDRRYYREERQFQDDKEWGDKKAQPKRNERELGAGEICEVLANAERGRQSRQGQLEQSLFAKAYREGKTANALAGGQPEIWKAESELGRVADGIPDRAHRLKALGNAVVPQIPELIGRAILEAEWTT